MVGAHQSENSRHENPRRAAPAEVDIARASGREEFALSGIGQVYFPPDQSFVVCLDVGEKPS
jgi:hypothetical protein